MEVVLTNLKGISETNVIMLKDGKHLSWMYSNTSVVVVIIIIISCEQHFINQKDNILY